MKELFSETPFNLKDSFDACSKTVTCPNYMDFAHVGHCLTKDSLQRVLCIMGMMIGLSLDDAAGEIILWIQIRRMGRPHVGGQVVVKIVSEPFLGNVGGV